VTEDDAAGSARRSRFAALPEPVRPEDWVETVDAADHPATTGEDEQARLLRLAGGA
jgi:hypothetical protein